MTARADDAEGDPLETGAIELLGQIPSSNETFLVDVRTPRASTWAIYKPELGERPLADFAPGLHRRERAAHVLSEALGWGIVPTTLVREDGPFGIGSLQRFVPADLTQHYFTILERAPEHHPALRRLALFDLLANNADRKAGHVLLGTDGSIHGIDHGLCFAVTFKLRTVIWDFAGTRIEQEQLADVAALAEALPAELEELLTHREVLALRVRARRIAEAGVLPHDPTGMRFPWPLI